MKIMSFLAIKSNGQDKPPLCTKYVFTDINKLKILLLTLRAWKSKAQQIKVTSK
jgi:hypothetical protein